MDSKINASNLQVGTGTFGDAIAALGTICMYTSTYEILTGWLASQTDMLSEDWEVV